MSAHREAPEISRDPVAASTDVYAFRSPDQPDTVTLIANFRPPDGPGRSEFGPDVLYQLHVSNGGHGMADLSYQFRFDVELQDKNTFLYNTGPIRSLDDPTWNRPQFYSVTRVQFGRSHVLARNLPVPPVNIGPRGTPDYPALAAEAVHSIGAGRKVFAGQRAGGSPVDVGSIFDLGPLRPSQLAQLIPSAITGRNGSPGPNVHTIAVQVPVRDLTRGALAPRDVRDARAVIGVYASVSCRQPRLLDGLGVSLWYGPYKQVARLGNPLVDEVILPTDERTRWNCRAPKDDKAFAKYVTRPKLAGVLPVLYPGVFPKLAAYRKARADLAAILLTGIPDGVVPGFQNYTGPVQADMLRLNLAVPPSAAPDPLGLLAGDVAGFPNGRRVFDDVVKAELRAVAGLTIPLVDPSFQPDAAAAGPGTSKRSDHLQVFPYLGTPTGAYQSELTVPAAP